MLSIFYVVDRKNKLFEKNFEVFPVRCGQENKITFSSWEIRWARESGVVGKESYRAFLAAWSVTQIFNSS